MRARADVPVPSQVGEVIAAAITGKRRLSFTYHGRRRVVEPQCLGLGAKARIG